MSGESTQGAALCAPAAVASAVSAAAVTSVFIENRLILEFSRQPIRIHANQALLNKSRTAIRRQYDASRSRDFAVSRCKLDRYLRFQVRARRAPKGYQDEASDRGLRNRPI